MVLCQICAKQESNSLSMFGIIIEKITVALSPENIPPEKSQKYPYFRNKSNSMLFHS